MPIAVGEIYGVKWEIAPLIEQNHDRLCPLHRPNVGGITEYMKIAALAETHYFGLIPHFTGPIGETALVHCLTATSVIALMEMTGAGRQPWPYLPQAYDFHNGKLWSNDRPGLGVSSTPASCRWWATGQSITRQSRSTIARMEVIRTGKITLHGRV